MIKRILAFLISFCLIFEQTGFAQLAIPLGIPGYLSSFAPVSDKFRPVHLRSIDLIPGKDNFELILDKGDLKDIPPAQLKETTQELYRYFQVGLALPNKYFWVNLRPDSPNEVIEPLLEKTDVGRVMLAADLQLKKDLANATSPQTPEGKLYWDRLYVKAGELYNQQDIQIPTLTRPWIVPGEIIIRSSGTGAFIYKSTLKVMLEQDYIKNSPDYNFSEPRQKELNSYSSQLIRELIIPKLTREVNSSRRYAPLRQVYYSLILAQWFKTKSQVKNIDSQDLSGLTSQASWSKDTYYQSYRKSFQKGEYNRQEQVSSVSGLSIRQYFSGGEEFSNLLKNVSEIPASVKDLFLTNEQFFIRLTINTQNGEVANLLPQSHVSTYGLEALDGGMKGQELEIFAQNNAISVSSAGASFSRAIKSIRESDPFGTLVVIISGLISAGKTEVKEKFTELLKAQNERVVFLDSERFLIPREKRDLTLSYPWQKFDVDEHNDVLADLKRGTPVFIRFTDRNLRKHVELTLAEREKCLSSSPEVATYRQRRLVRIHEEEIIHRFSKLIAKAGSGLWFDPENGELYEQIIPQGETFIVISDVALIVPYYQKRFDYSCFVWRPMQERRAGFKKEWERKEQYAGMFGTEEEIESYFVSLKEDDAVLFSGIINADVIARPDPLDNGPVASVGKEQLGGGAEQQPKAGVLKKLALYAATLELYLAKIKVIFQPQDTKMRRTIEEAIQKRAAVKILVNGLGANKGVYTVFPEKAEGDGYLAYWVGLGGRKIKILPGNTQTIKELEIPDSYVGVLSGISSVELLKDEDIRVRNWGGPIYKDNPEALKTGDYSESIKIIDEWLSEKHSQERKDLIEELNKGVAKDKSEGNPLAYFMDIVDAIGIKNLPKSWLSEDGVILGIQLYPGIKCHEYIFGIPINEVWFSESGFELTPLLDEQKLKEILISLKEYLGVRSSATLTEKALPVNSPLTAESLDRAITEAKKLPEDASGDTKRRIISCVENLKNLQENMLLSKRDNLLLSLQNIGHIINRYGNTFPRELLEALKNIAREYENGDYDLKIKEEAYIIEYSAMQKLDSAQPDGGTVSSEEQKEMLLERLESLHAALGTEMPEYGAKSNEELYSAALGLEESTQNVAAPDGGSVSLTQVPEKDKKMATNYYSRGIIMEPDTIRLKNIVTGTDFELRKISPKLNSFSVWIDNVKLNSLFEFDEDKDVIGVQNMSLPSEYVAQGIGLSVLQYLAGRAKIKGKDLVLYNVISYAVARMCYEHISKNARYRINLSDERRFEDIDWFSEFGPMEIQVADKYHLRYKKTGGTELFAYLPSQDVDPKTRDTEDKLGKTISVRIEDGKVLATWNSDAGKGPLNYHVFSSKWISEIYINNKDIASTIIEAAGGVKYSYSLSDLALIQSKVDIPAPENVKKSYDLMYEHKNIKFALNKDLERSVAAIIPSLQPRIMLDELAVRIFEFIQLKENKDLDKGAKEKVLVLEDTDANGDERSVVIDGHHRLAAIYLLNRWNGSKGNIDKIFVDTLVPGRPGQTSVGKQDLKKNPRSISEIEVELPDKRKVRLKDISLNFGDSKSGVELEVGDTAQHDGGTQGFVGSIKMQAGLAQVIGVEDNFRPKTIAVVYPGSLDPDRKNENKEHRILFVKHSEVSDYTPEQCIEIARKLPVASDGAKQNLGITAKDTLEQILEENFLIVEHTLVVRSPDGVILTGKIGFWGEIQDLVFRERGKKKVLNRGSAGKKLDKLKNEILAEYEAKKENPLSKDGGKIVFADEENIRKNLAAALALLNSVPKAKKYTEEEFLTEVSKPASHMLFNFADDRLVALIWYYDNGDQTIIWDRMATAPSYRRQGRATALLLHLAEHIPPGTAIKIPINEANETFNLYERWGFERDPSGQSRAVRASKLIENSQSLRESIDSSLDEGSYLSSGGSGQTSVQRDGGVKDAPGGIDFRQLPVVGQPAVTTALMPQLQQLAADSKMKDLDKEWSQIRADMLAPEMPYSRIKEYIAVCLSRPNCRNKLDQAVSCIVDILRMEEDQALATNPELKDILMYLS